MDPVIPNLIHKGFDALKIISTWSNQKHQIDTLQSAFNLSLH